MVVSVMVRCARCSVPYDWRKSPAVLRMTYCNDLCERADLGFSLDSVTPTTRKAAITC